MASVPRLNYRLFLIYSCKNKAGKRLNFLKRLIQSKEHRKGEGIDNLRCYKCP